MIDNHSPYIILPFISGPMANFALTIEGFHKMRVPKNG
jgi:hypothetical protein